MEASGRARAFHSQFPGVICHYAALAASKPELWSSVGGIVSGNIWLLHAAAVVVLCGVVWCCCVVWCGVVVRCGVVW